MIFHSHKMTSEERNNYIKRWKWKFAFFPKRIGTNEVVWLGWYQRRFQSETTAYIYSSWYEYRYFDTNCIVPYKGRVCHEFIGGW